MFSSSQGLAQEHHQLIPVEADEESCELGASAGASHSLAVDKQLAIFPRHSDIKCIMSSLPTNLHAEKESQRKHHDVGSLVTKNTPVLETLDEEESDSDEENPDEGLKIAWQYRKNVQDERLGFIGSSKSARVQSSVYCHSFDLSRTMTLEKDWIQLLFHCEAFPYDLNLHTNKRVMYFMLYRRLFEKIMILLASTPFRVVRVLFYHAEISFLSVVLPLLLARIREDELPVVVLVVARSQHTVKGQTDCTVRRCCDVVMETENFATRREYPPPPEFRDFQGLLKLQKISTNTSATAIGGGHYGDVTASKRPSAMLYGLKRDRRKLHIKLLHIPPEEYAEGGGSVGGSGVRSGAGRKISNSSACSSGSGTAPLDF
jgi:hypothetical protein